MQIKGVLTSTVLILGQKVTNPVITVALDNELHHLSNEMQNKRKKT